MMAGLIFFNCVPCRCSEVSRAEAAPEISVPEDILAVWDALCSGQPPPAVQSAAGVKLSGCA